LFITISHEHSAYNNMKLIMWLLLQGNVEQIITCIIISGQPNTNVHFQYT